MLLEPEVLNRLFHQWKYADRLDEVKYPMRYQNSRRDQRFEDWLWQQGFTVVQKDKKRYLRFSGDPKHLTLFLLKYSK